MSSIGLGPTDEHDVIEISAGPSNTKSPGYIDIPVTLTKESKFVIAGYLISEIHNKWHFDDILKVAKIVALHKGGAKSELSNYRPISILSPFNKRFEKIEHRRSADYWEKSNLFYSCQFGFKKNYSTNLAITCLYETILQKVMTIDQFVAFFWILRRHSTVSIIKFY